MTRLDCPWPEVTPGMPRPKWRVLVDWLRCPVCRGWFGRHDLSDFFADRGTSG